MLTISFAAKPPVDTQSTSVQSGMGLVTSGLIRIKNGFIQKLGGCLVAANTLFGNTANILLNWLPPAVASIYTYLSAVGYRLGLEVIGSGAAYNITPAGYVPTPGATLGTWTLATWGYNSDLISAWRGSAIYTWSPTLPLSGSGISLPVGGTSPPAVNGIFVAAPQQQMFAWGTYSAVSGAQDPLRVAWCDVADLSSWTATAINQAGSFTLSSGSEIIAGTWFNIIGLFWTDLDLWSAQYVGFPLIYGFNRVGQSCGLIAPRAFGVLGNIVAWMGQNDFHIYAGGSVHTVKCTVRDFVFNTIYRDGPIHCDVNSQFWEITWRFSQIGNTGACNAYVKWNLTEDMWDVWADPIDGTPNSVWLTAWTDEAANQPPMGIDYDANLLVFEYLPNGFPYPITQYNGEGLDSFYRTGWFYLAEGQEAVFVERIMPDFLFTAAPGGSVPSGSFVTMTFYLADEVPYDDTDYPIRTYGPYTVTSETPYIIIRGSGRVMSYRVDCTDPDTFYREGKHMARVSITGRAR